MVILALDVVITAWVVVTTALGVVVTTLGMVAIIIDAMVWSGWGLGVNAETVPGAGLRILLVIVPDPAKLVLIRERRTR